MVGLFLLFMLVATVNSSDLEDDKRMPPSFEKPSKRYYLYNELETVELPCKATGIPDVTYEWLYNGAELQVGSGTKIIQTNPNDGHIQITKANKDEHSGTYQCRAGNKYGTAMSPTITLAQTELFHKLYPSRTRAVNVGDPLSLEPFNDITSTPKAKYSWKTVQARDNEWSMDVKTSKRIAVDQETGILYFANTLRTDGLYDDRVYKLNAKNRIKDMTTGLSPYKVIVTTKEPNVTNKPVQFLLPISGNKKVVGIVRENVTLKCFFGGLPSPEIEWELPPGGPPPNRIDCFKESNTECEIKKLQFSDAGEYKCTGKNPSGSKTATFNLTVESRPTFAVKPENKNISEGKTATFECKPEAVPPAKIEWFSNSKRIDVEKITDPRFTISKDMTELTLTDVRKNLEGTPYTDLQVFQCRISNEHGDAFASAYLNVLLRTTVNSRQYFTLNVTEESIQPEMFNLSCNPTTDSLLKDQLDQQEISWKFNSKRIRTRHPYYLQNNGRNLLINITVKDTNFNKFMGEYICTMKSPLDKLDELKFTFQVLTSIPIGDAAKESSTSQTSSDIIITASVLVSLLFLALLVMAIICRLKKMTCVKITSNTEYQGIQMGDVHVYDYIDPDIIPRRESTLPTASISMNQPMEIMNQSTQRQFIGLPSTNIRDLSVGTENQVTIHDQGHQTQAAVNDDDYLSPS